MIVTVQGQREHEEEEDMSQEREDRHTEKQMSDEAQTAAAPLDQYDL